MLGKRTEIWVALAFLALGAITVFVWIPLDIETPPIYEFRRQTFIGDSLLPLIAGVGVMVFAAFHLIVSLLRPRDERLAPFDAMNVVFFLSFFAICAVSLALFFWAGPVALSLFGPEGTEEAPVTYRTMRATAPWKYIGFVLGGFVLVFGVTSLIEGRVRASRAGLALLTVAVLILIFDVPFDTLLLPPNGDF